MSDTPTRPKQVAPEPLEVESLARGNPAVDADQLREAQRLLKQLREGGVSPRGYGIAPPHQRLQLNVDP